LITPIEDVVLGPILGVELENVGVVVVGKI